MSTTIITMEEWLQAITRSTEPSQDAYTVAQWSDKLGMNVHKASRWVRTGMDNGWIETAPVVVTELNGKQRRIVGFRLTNKPGRKK